MYLVQFLRYSASKNGVTLKPAVVQDHWKWRRLIVVYDFVLVRPKSMALGTVFELFDVELYRDLEIWIRGHSR